MHRIEQSIKNVLDDEDNAIMTYVKDKDIKGCLPESQVIVLEAQLGAELKMGSLPKAVNKSLLFTA